MRNSPSPYYRRDSKKGNIKFCVLSHGYFSSKRITIIVLILQIIIRLNLSVSNTSYKTD